MYRILLLLTLVFSPFAFSAPVNCPDNRCVAVVNAGNSGSRLYIYHYDMDDAHTPVNIQNIYSKRVEPGIASIPLQKRAVSEHLTALFADVSYTDMPVYFYATSGMRMLNFARQIAYYAKVTHWFSKHPELKLVTAKTLTSKDEALYGWLAVNYELGTLSSSNKPLVAVVDSGSASVQVTYPIANTQHVHPDDYTKVNIYGRSVALFTHGFLGLGQDEIRSQYLDWSACFPKHYPLPNGSSGAGNFGQCEKVIKPLINEVHQVSYTVQPGLVDNPNQQWYIIGGISAMLQEKPYTFENHFTADALAERSHSQVCQQDWAVLGTLYPESKHMFARCFNAAYFHALLTEGLGVNAQQPIRYISNKTSTNDWTLGVVLQHKIT